VELAAFWVVGIPPPQQTETKNQSADPIGISRDIWEKKPLPPNHQSKPPQQKKHIHTHTHFVGVWTCQNWTFPQTLVHSAKVGSKFWKKRCQVSSPKMFHPRIQDLKINGWNPKCHEALDGWKKMMFLFKQVMAVGEPF